MTKKKQQKKQNQEKHSTKEKQNTRPRAQKVKQSRSKVYPKDTERGANIKVKIKWLNDKQGGHHHIIGDSIDDKHVSVGLTSKSRPGKSRHKNIELESRILDKKTTSFIRREAKVLHKDLYTGNYVGYVTTKDKEQIDNRIAIAKKKYKDKKNKKTTNKTKNK